MFVQKLNPLTGEADWVLVNDPGLGDEDDASADLVATSSYLDMLTDTRRNVAYNAALRRVLPARQHQHRLLLQQQQQRTADAAAATTQPLAAATALRQPGADTGGGGGGSEGVRVLDIGTGTGLLAMMAARALGHECSAPAAGITAATAAAAGEGASAGDAAYSKGGSSTVKGDGEGTADAPPSAPVVACEVFPPMQNLARRVVAANGLSSVIRIVNKRSDEIIVRPPGDAAAAASAGSGAAAPSRAAAAAAAARARVAAAVAGTAAAAGPDMYGKADVIVTEIFDSELLGEGMIPTMRHAVQHLLKDGGVVIPATSRVYGQVVQCPLMHQMTGLRFASDGSRTGIDAGTSDSARLLPHGGARASPGDTAAVPSAAGAGAVAAATRVLRVLGELDARARAAFYRGDELYEVREMHVDLLYHYSEARRRGRSPGVSGTAPTKGSIGSRGAAGGMGPETTAVEQEAQLQGQHQQQQPPPQQREGEAMLLQPLSEAFLVFEFDWLRPPPPSGRRTVLEVPMKTAGSAHAVLLWWQLGMTPEDAPPGHHTATTTATTVATSQQLQEEPPPPQQQQQQQKQGLLLLSTAPGWLGDRPEVGGDCGPLEGVGQQWRDHWKQCWSQLADDAPTVQPGDVLRLAFEHDDLNIRHKMLPPTAAMRSASAAPGPNSCSAAAAAAAASEPTATAVTAAATSEPMAATATAAAGCHSAREVLEALRAEAEAEAEAEGCGAGQQLLPLLSWLGPQALLQLGDAPRLSNFGSALQCALAEAGATDGGRGGAEVVVVDGSQALGLMAATHPAVGSVTLLQESSVAAANWLKAAASQLGVSTKIRAVRSETYFKRLAAARPTALAATTTAATSPPAAAAATAATTLSSRSNTGANTSPAGPAPMVLISEPYFSEFEQLVPWAHLKFWRDYDVIRASAATAGGGGGGGGGGRRLAAFPKRARLTAVAASLPELWRTRCALGRIEGLDLSAANAVLGVVGGDAVGCGSVQLGTRGGAEGGSSKDEDEELWGTADSDEEGGSGTESGEGNGGVRQPLPILPYSIWQAGGGYEELSGREELLCLDCSGHLDDVEGGAVLTAVRTATCHAVVLWMNFDLTSPATAASDSPLLTVSTAPAPDGGPGPSVQGVYLLRQPVELTRGSRLHVAATFDGLDADVSVEVTVMPPPEEGPAE